MENLPSLPLGPEAPSPEVAAARTQQQALYSRAEALLKTPEFQWFLESCIGAELTAAQKQALDTKETLEARNIAAHVREALERIGGWATEQRDSARSYLATKQP